MAKYSLDESAARILPPDHGMLDPKRWLVKQLRNGRFRGQKIGRRWFMTDADITAAEQTLYREQPAAPGPVKERCDNPSSILSGISKGSLRRLNKRSAS